MKNSSDIGGTPGENGAIPRESEILLSYLAGIVDGEGYIGILESTSKRMGMGYASRVAIQVAMTDFEIPILCHSTFGGGIRAYKTRNAIHKQSMCWYLNERSAVVSCLNRLLPYLRVKKEQAQIVLEFIAGCQKDEYTRWHKIPEHEITRRRELKNRISVLNHRGVSLPVETERTAPPCKAGG